KEAGAKSPITLGSGDSMAVLSRHSEVSDSSEIWSGSVTMDEVKPLFAAASLRAREMIAVGDGKTSKITDATHDISAAGLEAALRAACKTPDEAAGSPEISRPAPSAAAAAVALP